MMDNNTSMEKENFFTNGKQKITPIEIGREMQDSFLQYAMSVIVARALPDVRDGLKPVHRRILYTMFEKGLTPDKAYHKCADTVGAVLGSYHPHGDASVYDALVRLAQNFSMRYMLVDGQGNFGSVDGDPPAAYRYTEARMSKIALEMLTDIHKETVPFIPNYDDRLKEPEVLPSRFPNILVNGSIGIAVGMATNIPPHNLGEVIDGIIDVDNSDPNHKRLPFEPDKMNALLGLDLSAEEQKKLLEKLDFKIENNEVVVPFFRTDINRMCDVAEEVARMYGYDKIPTTLYAGEMVQGESTPSQQAERAAALVCREAGFDESMSHSFISPKFYDMIGWDENDPRRISTTILNPLGENFSVMRTTVLPSMLDNLAHNHAHRNPTASLYELGTIYTPTVKDGKADPDVLPHEEKILTLGSYGRLSFFQFKGAIEALLRELNIKGASFAPEKANPSYHPGRCAKVLIDGKEIGVFGTIHPTVAARYGLSGEVLAAELQMDALLAAIDPEKLYHPLPKFPASTRDIAVLVDDAVPAASMQATVEKAAGKLLESVKLFDVYKGKGIPEGKKSVAYSLSMRAPDRTLTDEECDKAMRAAISALETEFGAQLRG